MTDLDMEQLHRKIDAIAGKLETLSASFDKRFGEVNTRFDAVDKRFGEVDRRFDRALVEISEHFVEQRQYTELAFDTLSAELRAEMRAGFAGMQAGFEQIDRRLALFIETQGGINQSDHRRIGALEHARRRRRS